MDGYTREVSEAARLRMVLYKRGSKVVNKRSLVRSVGRSVGLLDGWIYVTTAECMYVFILLSDGVY